MSEDPTVGTEDEMADKEMKLWSSTMSGLDRMMEEPWRRKFIGVTLKPTCEAPPTYVGPNESETE